jgi:hypothetical protein
MRARQHVSLLLQVTAAWLFFWLIGLPDYYQQYPTAAIGVACVLLSVLISLFCLAVLLKTRPQRRREIAWWLSLYFSLPFAVLDTLYCGVYLGHGADYLWKFWYLTVFYVSPWMTLLPTESLLRRSARA